MRASSDETGTSASRVAALEILRAVRNGAFADRALESATAFLEEDDRRLAQELSYGALRLRGRLDYVIDAVVAGGTERLEPEILDILRLGAYQLLGLDRVPAYAAVSEAVEAAKRASGKGAAGLANAVLRKLSERSWDAFGFPRADVDPLGYLTVWGSHPRWLVERWLGRWSFEDVQRLVAYNNRRPGVFLSVIGPLERALETLRLAGVEAEPVRGAAGSVRIEPPGLMAALDRVQAVVQDPGAAAVVEYMALDPGSKVVDLCAAPGGKAALLSGRGHEVWAFDVSSARLGRLLENRTRLGLSRLYVARADARRPPVAEADVILLDVPCSGTGTLGRHPDGRWRIQAGGLAALVTLQRCLLDGAAEAVGPGGLLVYATCSLEPEENEEQVTAFLARHTEFVLERVRGNRVGEELLDSEGSLRVLPQRHDMDGAYAARLRRRSV